MRPGPLFLLNLFVMQIIFYSFCLEFLYECCMDVVKKDVKCEGLIVSVGFF